MVEENTTTCACQGGWMCPNCADQHRAEISRLKAELSEAKSIINDLTGRHGMQTGDMSGNSFEWRTKYTIIEHHLAEARAENERIGSVLGLQEYTKHIRQEAIKECLEFIDPITQIHVKQRFGLEG